MEVLKELWNVIIKLIRNGYSARRIYLALLMVVVIIYFPLSPISSIDLNYLSELFPIFTWSERYIKIILILMESLFFAIPFLAIFNVACYAFALNVNSITSNLSIDFDMLSFYAAKVCILFSMMLLIFCRFTPVKESVILEQLAYSNIVSFIGSMIGAAVSLYLFVRFLIGKPL